MRRLLPLILVLVIVVVAAACGDDTSSTDAGGPGDGSDATTTVAPPTTLDPDTPEGALAAARARWAENGLASYRLATTEICFCPETLWRNTVVDGEVVSHEPAGEQAFFDPGPRSMVTLYDEIAAAIDAGYETLDVEYHPETGAVISYYVDVDAMMADEEYGVRVTSLTPYDPDAPPVIVEAAALVDDYGCGYGFAKGNPEQTLGRVIYFSGEYVAGGPDLSTPLELASDDWYAAVQVGSDLFANWCDDVIEIDEPTPIVDETWTVVDGTLTVTPPAPTDCGGDVVTATLAGAVVESTDGERIVLDDLTLTNNSWGCFAG